MNQFDQQWLSTLSTTCPLGVSEQSTQHSLTQHQDSSDQTHLDSYNFDSASFDFSPSDISSGSLPSFDIPEDLSNYLSLQDDLLDPLSTLGAISSTSSATLSPGLPLDDIISSNQSSSGHTSLSPFEESLSLHDLTSTEGFNNHPQAHSGLQSMQNSIDLPPLQLHDLAFGNVDHSIAHGFDTGSRHGGTHLQARPASKLAMISPPETTISSHNTPSEYSNRPAKRPRSTATVLATKGSRSSGSPEYSDEIDKQSVEGSEEERQLEKRRRNTMAARRFRKRKQDHVSELADKLADVTRERDDLRLRLAKWEGEVMALRKLLTDRRRD